MDSPLDKRKVAAWSLYDWANSAYFTTVVAGFFPVYFKQYWSADVDAATSTFYLGLAHAAASLLIAVVAPVLGAIADAGGKKRQFLFAFSALGIAATLSLAFIGQGQWFNAALVFAISGIGAAGANIFYDSLLVNVASAKKVHFVSALGFALGYLGGGLLFAINVAMTLWPRGFGLADAGEAVRMSFVTVAVWWALFAIPLFVYVREPKPPRLGVAQTVRNGLRQFTHTFREVRRLRMVFLFLLAYWLYIDAVDTVIRMAVDYGIALGFDASALITALLLTQFVAVPAALGFGYIGQRVGAKPGIYLGIAVYIGVILWAMQMTEAWEFYGLAVAIGLVQGGVQSLSRSLYTQLIPANKAGEFFGFYNMLGKFAAILGPILMGLVAVATDSNRLSLLALIVLFVAGGALLYFVDEDKGREMARSL